MVVPENILYFVLGGIVVVFAMILYNKKSKWLCSEGNCVESVLGSHDSLESCEQVCVDDTPISTPTYSCNSSVGKCQQIDGPGGQYENLSNCQANCKAPTYYIYRQPWRRLYTRRRRYGDRYGKLLDIDPEILERTRQDLINIFPEFKP